MAARLIMVGLVLVVIITGTMVNGAPPKKVKCQDKKFPSCYHRNNLFCPNACPQNCHVNCTTCEPVCPAPPPRKVKCQGQGTCHGREMTCPKRCPQNCVADCKSCKPVCPPPKPIKVRCQDKRYNRWCHKELTCPVKCPTTCKVDCIHCKPVCSAPVVYHPPPPPPYIPSPPPPPPSVIPGPPPPPSVIPSPVDSSPPPPVPSPVDSSPPPPPLSVPSPVDSSPPPPPPPSSIPSPVDSSPPPPPPSVPSPVVSSSPPPPSVPIISPPPSNASEAAGGKRVRCKNKTYPSCYFREHRCPSSCPDSCEVDCVTCSPVCDCNKPGTVCQDPRFVGADGLTFYFHGQKDRDFCIVSDDNLHINAHFIGKRNNNMGRDFTWVQSLAILFDNHQIYVGAKKTATWDDSLDRLELSFDKEAIELEQGEGNEWELAVSGAGVRIARTRDANSVVIEVEGNFKIKATVVPITKQDSKIHKYGITDEDCFAHLDLGFKFYSLSAQVNGVLGQTYASNYVSRVKMGVDMPVLGGQREYATSSLFSADCAVARFEGKRLLTSSDRANYMNCESGMDGPAGVVCRK